MAPPDGPRDESPREPNLELPSLFGRRRRKDLAKGSQERAGDVASSEPAPAPTSLRPTEGAKRPPPSAPPRSDAVAKRPPPSAPPRPPAAPAVPERPQQRGPEMSYAAPAEPATTIADPADAQAADPMADPMTEPRRARTALLSKVSLPTISRPQVPRPRFARPSAPSLASRTAAALTGVLVALTGATVLWLFLQGCTVVRGVSSCGGFGLVGIAGALAAQLVVAVALLTLLRVAEPRATAVLGVGIAAAVSMVLLYASLPTPATVLALLVLTPVAFVVAAGVTTATVDP